MLQAKLLYDAIKESNGFYHSPVDPSCRSCMNVPFTIPSDSDLEKKFLTESSDAGFVRPFRLHADSIDVLAVYRYLEVTFVVHVFAGRCCWHGHPCIADSSENVSG